MADVRLSAELRINKGGLENLKQLSPDIAFAISSQISAQVVQEAKAASRVLTGEMRKGWTRRRIGQAHQGGYVVYDSVPWTIHNEFGTYKMTAQPMLGPAMERGIRDAQRIAQEVIESAVGGSIQIDDSESGD